MITNPLVYIQICCWAAEDKKAPEVLVKGSEEKPAGLYPQGAN